MKTLSEQKPPLLVFVCAANANALIVWTDYLPAINGWSNSRNPIENRLAIFRYIVRINLKPNLNAFSWLPERRDKILQLFAIIPHTSSLDY